LRTVAWILASWHHPCESQPQKAQKSQSIVSFLWLGLQDEDLEFGLLLKSHTTLFPLSLFCLCTEIHLRVCWFQYILFC
jgi:hypothetical protein